MAKETTIIFVYDTELLKREEDDPNSAILYFYPTWVSDQQKTALCGQLMGTIRCLKSIFSMPKTVSLQTGKFFIIENNQFILAIGSDRNIPDWVLEHRANLFFSLINFFHKDFVNLALLYRNAALCAKLYHIFDTYIKLMLFGGNIFSQVSLLEMPKSGSTVFMEAIAFLDRCRDFPNALGGTILYHNKVVATHLSASTTKKIVFADPYRIKNPAEILETNFDLPLGVQLLQVYITNKEFCSLHENALRSRCILQHLFSKKSKRNESSQPHETQEIQETSVLKRDTSLLFTSVAEEGSDNSAQSSVTYRQQNSQRRSRPNSLNLKSITLGLNSQEVPLTSYSGQSSIANTPMTESKIFLRQESAIICSDNKNMSVEELDKSTLDQKKDLDHTLKENCSKKLSKVCPQKNLGLEMSKNQSIMSGSTQVSGKDLKLNSKETRNVRKFPADLTQAFFQSMHHKKTLKKSSSLVDLSEILNSISNNVSQYSSLKNRIIMSPKRSIKLKRSNTIHDPVYPIFKHNGIVVSQYYLDKRMQHQCLNEEIIMDKKNGKIYPKAFSVNTDTKREGNKGAKIEPCQSRSEDSRNRRKSLTLPLKPLNAGETHKTERKYSTGVQLTPLMNKLTILAVEEQRKSGKISISPIPGKEVSDLSFKSKEARKLRLQEDCALQKCVLFIGGQHDVVLGLLLQEDCSKDRETIEKLWELCTENLPKLEKQINYSLQSAQSRTGGQNTELYSFLNVDSAWDTTKRVGPWENEELNNVSRLCGDFKQHDDISDIFLRNPESVIYGHQLESSQIFYHENAPVINGLINPNDAIGSVQQKARKSIERDHNIVLP